MLAGMASRDLARGALLAEQIASALSGRAHVLAQGDWPVAFLSFGDCSPLAFADHPSSAWLEMPDGRSWSLATRADLDVFVREAREVMASYRALQPRPIALGDVAIAVFPTLERVAGAPWRVSFGRPLTSSLSLELVHHRVRLRREGRAVRVEVFMAGGREPTPTTVASASELASIAIVVERQLESVRAEIAAMLARRDAEAKRERARTDASFDAVLAALHRGERFERRGPRWAETYFVEAGELRCKTFDEGFESVRPVDHEALRGAMDRSPEVFVPSTRARPD